MIEVKKILVPTDFSPPSVKALAYGRAFARLFQSSLHVLHVIEEPFVHGFTMEGYIATLPEFSAQLEVRAKEELARQLSEADRRELAAVETTRFGNPYSEIVAYAKEQDVDIIVMGTHGRGMVAQLLLGSVAERVVRMAPCPVLTVREPEHDFVLPPK